MFGWLRKLFASPKPQGQELALRDELSRLKARYDAAVTNDENRRHWANADSLSASAANSADVRLRLRTRARYESANNSYCRGMILTLASDLIGTGPRLQSLLDAGGDSLVNRLIEQRWVEWSEAIDLAGKLRVLKQAKTVDGEGFALFVNNPRLRGPIKLDLRLIEADQIATPTFSASSAIQPVDGIEQDGLGNVTAYHLLRYHPGDSGYFQPVGEYQRIDASQVLHWFRPDRPQQMRGIPEITPALPLFAQLRRYTLAVLAAAETAADFAAVLKANASPNTEPSIDGAQDFQTLELAKRMMTQLPLGWDITQLKAEQPTTTYDTFVARILAEIARCLNQPYIIASGDYAGANYSSGRLAHQVYFKSLRVERCQLELLLNRVYDAWLAEALRVPVPDYLPAATWFASGSPHRWFWDGWEHVDPTKEAGADQINLTMNATTLSDIYAERGQDWEEALRQRAREVQLMDELGLTPEPVTQGATDGQPAEEEDAETADAA